jgi:Ca2+-binding EF-hand superfamily protein
MQKMSSIDSLRADHSRQRNNSPASRSVSHEDLNFLERKYVTDVLNKAVKKLKSETGISSRYEDLDEKHSSVIANILTGAVQELGDEASAHLAVEDVEQQVSNAISNVLLCAMTCDQDDSGSKTPNHENEDENPHFLTVGGPHNPWDWIYKRSSIRGCVADFLRKKVPPLSKDPHKEVRETLDSNDEYEKKRKSSMRPDSAPKKRPDSAPKKRPDSALRRRPDSALRRRPASAKRKSIPQSANSEKTKIFHEKRENGWVDCLSKSHYKDSALNFVKDSDKRPPHLSFLRKSITIKENQEIHKKHEAKINAQKSTLNIRQHANVPWKNLLNYSQLHAFRKLFQRLDTTKSGGISAAELYEEIMATLPDADVSYKQVQEIMKEFDIKKTGQIEFDEFLFATTNPENYLKLISDEDYLRLETELQDLEAPEPENKNEERNLFFSMLRNATREDSFQEIRKFYVNRVKKLNDHVIHDWSAGQRCIGLSYSEMLRRYEHINQELMDENSPYKADYIYSPYAKPLRLEGVEKPMYQMKQYGDKRSCYKRYSETGKRMMRK